jgi:hypothetical protein
VYLKTGIGKFSIYYSIQYIIESHRIEFNYGIIFKTREKPLLIIVKKACFLYESMVEY